MGFSFKKIVKQLNPAKAVKNALKSAGEINAAGFGAIAKGVGAFGGVVKAGTQILRENPELAGIAGNALGMPGVGGAFSSGGGGGMATMPDAGFATSGGPAPSTFPTWAWFAIGGGLLLAVVLLLRKKS